MRPLLLFLAVVCGCAAAATEADVRAALATRSGRVVLPAGTVEIAREILLPKEVRGLTIEGAPGGTVLRAADTFKGRAILIAPGGTDLALVGVTLDGNRHALARPTELSILEKPFSELYENNVLILQNVKRLRLERVRIRAAANYAAIVTGGSEVTIDQVEVENSGSRNARGRNNASGGILFEEGTAGFAVLRSRFRNILGNAVWTHSWSRSPRCRDGVIRDNWFDTVARDAIQVGHAVNVRVENNSGKWIGYPTLEVDLESAAAPVGIDTAGNVEGSIYTHNRFGELNGKCIDLDGFHDGEVSHNTCISRGKPEDYPAGQFGIVINNSNPEMRSQNIRITDNVIDGAKFGGIFLIGQNHTVERNKFLNLNLAQCNESRAKFGCIAIAGEPDVLQSGIYLGRLAAEWAKDRADASRGHVIRGNTITGYRMRERCIVPAPGVSLAASRIENNTCEDTKGGRR